MGDIVHALPLAADIMHAIPYSTIDWLVEESFASIPTLSRHVAQVRQVALRRWRRRPLDPAVWREVRVAKSAVREARYDLVLDVQGLAKSAWLARWTGAPVAGFDSMSARESVAANFYRYRFKVPSHLHAVERCRRLGALALGYSIGDAPQFGLGPESALATAPTANNCAVLLVNASRATKLWNDEHWVAVERWLADGGIASKLFAGSLDEQRRAELLAKRMRRAMVAPPSSLNVIAAQLAAAPIVIGLDTGLTHLAAALGRPTVGIFCDYDPALTGLVGDASAGNAVISVGSESSAPAAAEVIAAAEYVMKSGAVTTSQV